MFAKKLLLASILVSLLPFLNLNAQEEPFRVVLEPLHETTLSADVTSTVTTINKRMGESFKKGDVLMTLDDTVFRANYQKTVAVLQRNRAELDAQQKLFKDKAASLLDLRDAEAKVSVAKAELALAEKQFKGCTLIAPYDGEVQELKVQEFEHIEAGKPMMDILDDHILIAKLLLPSRVGIALKIGQSINIVIAEAAGTYPATITHIAPGIDPTSSLIKVDSEIDNSKGLLRAGMIGTLVIASDEAKP